MQRCFTHLWCSVQPWGPLPAWQVHRMAGKRRIVPTGRSMYARHVHSQLASMFWHMGHLLVCKV